MRGCAQTCPLIEVPKSSADAIVKAVLELWDNYPLRVSMGRRSRRIAETMTWKQVAEAYIRLYERTLSALQQC